MPERIDGFSGAPQSVYSDQFLTAERSAAMGYKLEVPPIHPVLAAITLPAYGAKHAGWMRELAHMQVVIALMRDGFDPRSAGGTVALRDDGTPLLDYPLNDHFWEAARHAFATMAQIQFAAGANVVMPVHATGVSYRSWNEARAGIAALPLAPLVAPVFSAHVMGGSAFGPDPRRSAVDPNGRYHHLDNLYVLDGSLFPTSIGANPQLSIYAIVAKLASALAAAL